MTNNSKYKPGCPVFELTLNCNLNCVHCGSSAGKKVKDELSTKDVFRICKELADIGTGGVALMGGEVLLRKDWYEISKEIKDLGMYLSIVTNGYFDPEKFIPKFRKLEVDSFSIGFDGMKETHNYIRGTDDAFDKTLAFIDVLNREGFDPCPITTFHKLNFKEFFDLRDLIMNRDLDWHINAAALIGRFPKDLLLSLEEHYALGMLIASSQKKYSKERVIAGHNFGFHSQFIPDLSLFGEWNGCFAGKTALGIKSNGDVNGCLPLPERFIEGNIKYNSLVELWNSPDFCKFNRDFKENDLGGFCKTCKYRMSCKGGCTLNSATLAGKPHRDPTCFYRIEQEIFGSDMDNKIQEIKEKYSIDL